MSDRLQPLRAERTRSLASKKGRKNAATKKGRKNAAQGGVIGRRLLSGGNGCIGLLLAGSVGLERDDHAAASRMAQLAACALL